MKTRLIFIFSFALLILFAQKSLAQNEYLDYRLRDTLPDKDFTIFNMNDFRDALVQLGINVYKWNLPIPQDKDYKVHFYLKEYEKGKLIKDTVLYKSSSKYWGFGDEGLAKYKYFKNLRIISEMPDEKDEYFKLKFSLNSGKFQFGKYIKDRPELRSYWLRRFAETDFEIGKDIPLLLYTSGWEIMAGGKKSRQYCGPNNPSADLNDNSFDDSLHYIIVGYRVLDEDFYGRD